MIFAHQQHVFDSLRATARALFRGEWRKLPGIRPRFNQLVIGPSGVGKTHVVRMVAAEMKVPLLELAFLNWVPIGASNRGARPTWLDLAAFCSRHSQGVIFLDEIDKCSERSSWITHLRVEAFGCLDRVIPPTLTWDDFEDGVAERAQENLSQGMMLIGGGAFQELWMERSRPSVGFHPASSGTELGHDALSQIIPTEIANRFLSPALVLPPLGEKDCLSMVEEICRQLPARNASILRRRAKLSLGRALREGLGCRWIEQLLLEMLVESEPVPD